MAAASTDFDQMVEAVRVGSIFAHDQKAYDRWQRRPKARSKPQRGLTGHALEAAVMRIANQFPDNVVVGAA